MPEVASELRPRLEAAAQAVTDAREALTLRIKARDALVVEAIDDHGMSQKVVADLIGVSQPHVNRLLTLSQPEATAAA